MRLTSVGFPRAAPSRQISAPARPQRALNIAERRRRVGEKHHTHARGREIEGGRLEREHLRVSGMQSDIAQSALGDVLPCGAEHRLGDVDCDDPAMLADRLGERQGQRPGSTTDLENVLAAVKAQVRQQ
jgi:hypothetical protein